MRNKTAVVDRTGNHQENLDHWAKNLGTAKLRRTLFNLIYGRGTRPRSRRQLMAQAGINEAAKQLVQNQLEYLYRKDLIERMENDGSVKDGSRYLYLKDEHVRANKDRIVTLADNPKIRKAMPTKRRPAGGTQRLVIQRMIVTKQDLKRRNTLGVLYLMSNPIKKHALRVDLEVSRVAEEIRGSKYRDNIELHQSPAANLQAILRGLNDHRPRIVHFSGHGNTGGIAMDARDGKMSKTQFVNFDLLGKALQATDSPPEVVVLNACQSAGGRAALLKSAKAIVVMQDSISDNAAVAFAVNFYGAIASGQSVQAAFDQGCVATEVVSLSEASTPTLQTASGVDPKKLKLV
ncbi:CHAT domain-containing protein [uncultured Bradyrhizobium sp.]|uniref:CHAT domain-containing protein n=1 Tax=uncultured Bradyrhizobium sp. TaxID=199684 RepID=UPI0026356CFE|nr:CHAT domain-containing protein [uncultured Bradyrhizobium sp.]